MRKSRREKKKKEVVCAKLEGSQSHTTSRDGGAVDDSNITVKTSI